MSQVNMNDKQVDSLVLEKLSLHQDWIIVDKEFFLDLLKHLAKEHTDDIKKLVEKQKNEWIELWELYVIAHKSEQMAKDDQAKIDDIKSQLWL